jgi:hypothetical protein
MTADAPPAALGLRAGDWVEVRSKEEILRTLDARGMLDNLPFMPEMFAWCGQRVRVSKAAHKTCDTISGAYEGRRMTNAVHLDDLRCDGAAHSGCEAACLIYWKEAWLKRADGVSVGAAPAPALATPVASPGGCSEAQLTAATLGATTYDKPGPGPALAGPSYVCQATEVLRFTTPLPWWDVRQYVDDYRSGNVGLRRIAHGGAYAVAAKLIGISKRRPRMQDALMTAYDRVQTARGGVPFPRRMGKIPAGQKTPPSTLDLKAGDLVRVKSYEEILATLDTDNKNRGLYFDAEHVPYCGGTFRVRSSIRRIVDERNGRMLEFKTPSIILEGASCKACYSNRRLFCPRALYPYWREVWLERAEAT